MICGECGNVTAPGVGFPNHVYCKRFLLHMEKRKDASRCLDFIPKPITNADCFREMEDEKIAEWMSNKVDCQYCPVRSEWCMESEASCRSNWLDWLKQEEID